MMTPSLVYNHELLVRNHPYTLSVHPLVPNIKCVLPHNERVTRAIYLRAIWSTWYNGL